MRNELVTINESELESVKEALKREYSNLLVLVVEKDTTSDIYLVNEKEQNKDPYLFCSLEDVIDYCYDPTDHPTIIAKIVSKKDDGVYWLAFVIAAMVRQYPDKVYKPIPYSFLTVSRCSWDSEARFLKGFEYLTDCKMINIAGKNYIIEYGKHSDVDEIFPMFGRYVLTKGDEGEERICQMISYTETRFGPFDKIEAWEDGFYPYIHNCYHGYFGKDSNGYIRGMTILCDYSSREDEKYQMFFKDSHITEYKYNVEFEKPLKELKFVRRDFEKTDSESRYTATDIWEFEYVDGSRAIMFNSIGHRDYPDYDGSIWRKERQRTYSPEESKFKCFIISEEYMKGIFSES